MVALGVVSVALLAVIGVLIKSTGALQADRKVAQASSISRQVLEAVRAGGIEIPDGTVTFDGRVGQPQVDGFPPAPYPQVHNEEGDFFVVVQVEPKPPALKSVTVDVYWNVDKKVTLQSYFGS
jgi:type II secretory pathway pseudopilin PulG